MWHIWKANLCHRKEEFSEHMITYSFVKSSRNFDLRETASQRNSESTLVMKNFKYISELNFICAQIATCFVTICVPIKHFSWLSVSGYSRSPWKVYTSSLIFDFKFISNIHWKYDNIKNFIQDFHAVIPLLFIRL